MELTLIKLDFGCNFIIFADSWYTGNIVYSVTAARARPWLANPVHFSSSWYIIYKYC